MDRDNATWLAHLGSDGPEQQAALSELRSTLLRVLRRAVRHGARADATVLEDAVQEALTRILDRLRQFEGRSRFLTWATAIAIRVAMTELRRRRWQDVSLDALVADGGFPIDGSTAEAGRPEMQSERRQILATMHQVIRAELTPRQRTALLAELKGMPQDEIARHLGSNRNAVYKLTHDARKRLKHGLEAAGYGAGDVHGAFSG